MKRRNVYLLAAVGAAVFATALALVPHNQHAYAIGLLGYNMFQGFNYTAFVALALEITGPKNALAGERRWRCSRLRPNVPISTMTWVDSHAHDALGLNGMFYLDAASAIVTAAVLYWLVLPRLDRWVRRGARLGIFFGKSSLGATSGVCAGVARCRILVMTTLAYSMPTAHKSPIAAPSHFAGKAWQQVLARDARADGQFVYAVKSTGIYCKPSCASRRPAGAQERQLLSESRAGGSGRVSRVPALRARADDAEG